jgi:hypothetical protein
MPKLIKMNYPKALLLLLLTACSTLPVDLDTFGIAKFFPTKAGTREWNSAHWNNGHARLIQYSGDPYDPTGWTDNHSSSSGDSLFIDGNGTLLLSGGGPRFHVNSTERYYPTAPIAKVPAQSFLNTEATAYYRRITTGGSNWDGMEIQARTDPLAHGSAGGDACDATGLASRFRDDGKWDWEKELKHSGSTVYSTRYNYDAPLFSQGTIPLNRWIGMKFIVYNIDNDTHVKLETYIDTVSDVAGGPPAQGGHWDFVGAMVDSGSNWPGADVSGCPDLSQNMAVTVGHGTFLIRTDNEACNWKMFSIREIDAGATRVGGRPLPGAKPDFPLCPLRYKNNVLYLDRPAGLKLTIGIFDVRGACIYRAMLSADAKEIPVPALGRGAHIVRVYRDKFAEEIIINTF